jgi:hypothetical protein
MTRQRRKGKMNLVQMRCGKNCTCPPLVSMPEFLGVYHHPTALDGCIQCGKNHKLVMQPKAIIAFPFTLPSGKKMKTRTQLHPKKEAANTPTPHKQVNKKQAQGAE